jgi:hypothetical protein
MQFSSLELGEQGVDASMSNAVGHLVTGCNLDGS